MNDLTVLIGKTQEEAFTYLKEVGYKGRVTKEDGQSFIVTLDYKTNRVNLNLLDGKVIHYEIG